MESVVSSKCKTVPITNGVKLISTHTTTEKFGKNNVLLINEGMA